MITLKSCPNCKNFLITEFRVISGGGLIAEIIPGVKVNAQIITRYCVCQDCNLIFQNPRLSDTELDKYYGTGYYRRTLTSPEELRDKNQFYRAKIDAEIIKKHLDGSASHLDIGCGRGYLLEEVGATIRVGIEPEVNYVKAKGVELYSDMNKIPYKTFDLVTAIHVLEHVPYPLEYLKSVAKFLGKDSYLIIEVPTWKSLGGPLRFPHLYHFEPDVLKLMCRQVGLSVIDIEFTPHLLLICKADDN